MYHFFAMLSRMKYINRWGLMHNTRYENLCEHSMEVALLAHALATLGNRRFGKTYNAERAAALGAERISSRLCSSKLPRGISPSWSRQQGTTVPSHRTAACSRRPRQKRVPLSGALKSGHSNFSACSRYSRSPSLQLPRRGWGSSKG